MLVPTIPATPYAVTDDTFVIPTIAAAPDGTFVSANSLVIRGAEPVIVDTGCALVRDDWAERAFSVVEPEDVRWIVISHDDHDHIGNIDLVLERCPNATLIVSYLVVARLVADVDLPIDRMQWKNEGDTLPIKVLRGRDTLNLKGKVRLGTRVEGRITADSAASEKATRIRNGILQGKTDK